MKLATCDVCGRLLQFEQSTCRGCGAPLGFLPEAMLLTALEDFEDGLLAPKGRSEAGYRRCVNAEANGCNWLVATDAEDLRCLSCRLNRNLADMSVPLHRAKWRLLECAKRRLLYAMLRFGQSVAPQAGLEPRGLAFDFLVG